MPHYRAPVEDMEFLLRDWLQADTQPLEAFSELSALATPVWQEAAKLAEDILFPLNQPGDAEGCRLTPEGVKMPSGFRDAYQAYAQGGWGALACAPAYGGQGLPEILNLGVVEMVCSSNLSFGLVPGLSHAAVNCVAAYASEELKQTYLTKLISGEWTGVMCLTEPSAGTDLGLLRTRAEPLPNGRYAITGTKIFISCGDQDVSDNIVHLILARLPDAPAGVKGISLFLAPKIWPNADGSLGKPNSLHCSGLEHKMGLHGSPTCVMEYEGAEAYLIGEPHKGLRAMFTMMNAARIYVGVQGLGLAEAAYQNALIYAKERLQGRAVPAPASPDKPADSILVHPDVRRMLLTMKSQTEGARALLFQTALHQDIAHRHPDPKIRQEADDFIQVITPIVKAHITDLGFEIANLGVQVLGGYGYIREYGMEQYVRDARIAQIYEGTNGVQALDLVGRKMSAHTGRYLRQIFHPVKAMIDRPDHAEPIASMVKALAPYVKAWQKTTLWMGQQGVLKPGDALAGATEYLRLSAVVYIGYLWVSMAETATRELAAGRGNRTLLESKLATANFYLQRILPQAAGLATAVTNGGASINTMPDHLL